MAQPSGSPATRWAALAGAAALSVAAVATARAAARRRREKRSACGGKDPRPASIPFEPAAAPLPQWLKWLEESPTHYRVLMREWEDTAWRAKHGWQGSDLIHGASSAVHIPCYFFSPGEKALRGPVTFGPGSESHHGLCHGGAMTSAMDDVLGHACFVAAGSGPWSGATVQVNCKLMKPVKVGQTLFIEGKVARQEKKKVFIEAHLSDENGDVYATMDGLSIAGAKLQTEESDVDGRKWIFDETHRTMYDSAWQTYPVQDRGIGG